MVNTIKLKQDKLVIHLSLKEYKKMIYVIDSTKNHFSSQLAIFRNIVSDSLENIHQKNTIVRNIIEHIIDCYSEINKYDVVVFLTGSYARVTNKDNSDIDIVYSYDPKYSSKMIKVEEIINYSISCVLDMPRTKIHSAMVEKIDLKNAETIEKTISNSDFVVNLVSTAGVVEYKYSKAIKKRMYLEYNSNTSIDAIYDFLKREIEVQNREWAHVFYPITNKKKFYDMYDKLYQYEKTIISPERIDAKKDDIKYQLECLKRDIANCHNSMIEFKKVFQIEEFALINNYISLQRDIRLCKNDEWYMINYYDNLEYLKSDPIFTEILEYMYTLFMLVSKYGYSYSVHECHQIAIDDVAFISNKAMALNKEIGGKL